MSPRDKGQIAVREGGGSKIILQPRAELTIKKSTIVKVLRGREMKPKISLSDVRSYDLKLVNRRRSNLIWAAVGLVSIVLLIFVLTPITAINIVLAVGVGAMCAFLLLDAFLLAKPQHTLRIYGRRRETIRAEVDDLYAKKVRSALSELLTAKASSRVDSSSPR